MSTISNAAQVMVDKLVADMQGQSPLSSEEQLLVAKALDTMKNNVTFEKALIAVVEEHLNTATSSLLSAEGKINAAKDAIVADADNLALIPTISTNVDARLNVMSTDMATQLAKVEPTVRSAVTTGMSKFKLGYYCHDKSLYKVMDSTGYQYRAINVASIDNYDSGEFYSFHDFGAGTGYRRSMIIRVNKQGVISQAIKTSQMFTGGTFGFMPFFDGTCRLCRYDSGTLYIQTLGAFTWEFNKSVDYQEFYYDKSTKDILVVSGGFLNRINGDGFVVDVTTTFVDQAAFTEWASANGYLRADSFCSYYNSSVGGDYVSNHGNYFSKPNLQANMNGYSTSYSSIAGFDLNQGIKRVNKPSDIQLTIDKTHITAVSGTTTYPIIGSFSGIARFEDIYGVSANLDIEVILHPSLYHHSSQQIKATDLISYSHQHKCLVWASAGYDYYSSSAASWYIITAVNFGR